MSTLVVFFSLDGNTRFIAGQIAEAIGADLVSLSTRKSYPTKCFRKYFYGGKDVLFKEKPALSNGPIDWERYDTIIIGSPVWAGSYAPPVGTFLSEYPIIGKRFAVFACHGGGGAEKCLERIKGALSMNEFIGEIDFVNPSKHPETSAAEAIKWASGLSC